MLHLYLSLQPRRLWKLRLWLCNEVRTGSHRFIPQHRESSCHSCGWCSWGPVRWMRRCPTFLAKECSLYVAMNRCWRYHFVTLLVALYFTQSTATGTNSNIRTVRPIGLHFISLVNVFTCTLTRIAPGHFRPSINFSTGLHKSLSLREYLRGREGNNTGRVRVSENHQWRCTMYRVWRYITIPAVFNTSS
jgi:hypothetical protein